MAYAQKNNNGSLFINEKKQNDTHPDYKGQIMIDGKEYWISGWRKVSKAGGNYMSLAVRLKEQKPTEGF